MNLHVPITEDLVSILDCVLGKGIVVESWIQLGLQGIDLRVADARAIVATSAVYVGYGREGAWHEDKDPEDLFPYWRRDLLTK